MRRPPNRTTADLSSYPDLVVIYLGMRVNSLKGLATLISFGPKIRRSVEAHPDGLLLHENLLLSLLFILVRAARSLSGSSTAELSAYRNAGPA